MHPLLPMLIAQLPPFHHLIHPPPLHHLHPILSTCISSPSSLHLPPSSIFSPPSPPSPLHPLFSFSPSFPLASPLHPLFSSSLPSPLHPLHFHLSSILLSIFLPSCSSSPPPPLAALPPRFSSSTIISSPPPPFHQSIPLYLPPSSSSLYHLLLLSPCCPPTSILLYHLISSSPFLQSIPLYLPPSSSSLHHLLLSAPHLSSIPSFLPPPHLPIPTPLSLTLRLCPLHPPLPPPPPPPSFSLSCMHSLPYLSLPPSPIFLHPSLIPTPPCFLPASISPSIMELLTPPLHHESHCPHQLPTSPAANMPRVIIIGAGMSGLSAAYRLTAAPESRFDLTILEASDRLGGRICSSQLGGERLEMGATWIHGIEGSPVHKVAQRIDALEGDIPWECMDGFPEIPVVQAEGGLTIDPSVVEPVVDLYRQLYSLIQRTDGGLQQFSDSQIEPYSIEDMQHAKKVSIGGSVGSYLREGLHSFLSAQEKSQLNGKVGRHLRSRATQDTLVGPVCTPCSRTSSSWNLRSLQEGIFVMRENLERSITAADSLTDLDLESNGEYWEYPGEHRTIGKGYSSVIHALAKDIPAGSIQFGKRVQKITWLNSKCKSGAAVLLYCEDGTVFEADHVIITVSLGVLKAEALGHQETADPLSNHGDAFTLGDQSKKASSKSREPSTLHQTDCSLFQPPLPFWKTDVISRLGFGVVDKAFFLMNPVCAEGTYPHMQFVFHHESQESCDEAARIPWWMRKNFSLYPIHRGSHVLCTWFTGKEALKMESLSNNEVIDGVLRTMSSFGFKERNNYDDSVKGPQMALSDAEKTPAGNGTCDLQDTSKGIQQSCKVLSYNGNGHRPVQEILRSSWGQNPLFRGSYSYVAVGSGGEDIDRLAEPLPRPCNGDQEAAAPLQLLFAGEATHRYCYSTTHGAYLSGLREAERLLKHYGLITPD